MKPIPAFLQTLLAAVSLAHGDVVTDWNETALLAIKSDRTAPPKAARALAMMHVAIYDAVNGISQMHEPYFVNVKAADGALPEAAASVAARLVLLRLFPAQQAAFDATYNKVMRAIPQGEEKRSSIDWGEHVAQTLLAERAKDGAQATVIYASRNPVGVWRPTEPAFAKPALPQWPGVKPFAMTSAAQFRPAMPPALISAAYADDFNKTKELGAKNSATRTAEQTTIAQFWADGPGTVTPPGHWNVIARELAVQRGNSMEENARLFALLNIAEADAGILCWDCKYACNFWRPITAIQNADLDENPATEKDADWMPLLATPPFPEYTSGHSSFSSAGATVLAAFFGTDRIPFTTASEDVPGVSRTYTSFSEAAAEAGMSRIYGGIHFMSANTQGVESGARLGRFVMENFLKKASAQQTASVPVGPSEFDTGAVGVLRLGQTDEVKQLD